MLITTLHGIFCDPASSQETRLNALDACHHFAPQFPAKLKSDLINQHSEYIAGGKTDRQEASRVFFTKMGMLGLLGATEKHALISRASRRLLDVHMEMNNFYNEPPFAQRLLELTQQVAVPETAQAEFVYSVALCATGRRSGVSHAAFPVYQQLIRNFSPREILLFLESSERGLLTERITSYPSCKERFKSLVGLLDPASIPTPAQKLYQKWRK